MIKVDIKTLRKKLGMTQQEFSTKFCVNVATLRDWEQQRYGPTGAARVLLIVIDKAPETVLAALESMRTA